MTDAPTIKFTGAGSRQQAAELGQTVTKGVSTALAGRTRPLHIDTLSVKLPANASSRTLEQVIRDAILRKAGRR